MYIFTVQKEKSSQGKADLLIFCWFSLVFACFWRTAWPKMISAQTCFIAFSQTKQLILNTTMQYAYKILNTFLIIFE